MRGLGLLLLIVGASEFAFRFLDVNMEHIVFKLFGAYRTEAAIGFVVLGAGLTLLSFKGKKKDKK